jgi:hypothetical protein
MGKLHKTLKKYSPGARLERETLGDKTFDQLHPLGTQTEAAYDAAKASEKALAEAEAVIPIPDEEELARQRRRANARRRGSSSSNVYTEDDRLGG